MFLLIGSILGALGVALGAFGAHVLEQSLTENDFSTFQTAVRYQMYHSILLMVIGIWYRINPDQKLNFAAWIVFGGTIVFCGSLYLIVFTGIRSFGAVAPIGGTLLIIGWAYLGWIAYLSR